MRCRLPLLLTSLLLAGAARADFYVVVNAANPERNLSAKEAIALYMGRSRAFTNGEIALILDLPRDDPRRAAFYQAVRSVRGHGMDMSSWLEYFVGGLATQMHETVERGKKAMRADLLVKHHELNERQAKVLGFLLDHEQMHIRDLAALCPGVNRRTLQRDLRKMEEAGLIGQKGAARQSLYALKAKVL